MQRTQLFTLACFLAGCGGDASGPAALRVVSVTPADLAAGVPLAATVTVVVSESLDASTVSGVNVRLKRDTATVPSALQLSPDGRSVTLAPTGALGNNHRYRLELTTALESAGGQRLAAPFQSIFSTLTDTASVGDPAGDTFGTAGGLQPDVTSLSATQQGPDQDVLLVIGFSHAVAPPGSPSGSQPLVVVDLDVDQNRATGGLPQADFLLGAGTTGMGAEFWFAIQTVDYTATGPTGGQNNFYRHGGSVSDPPAGRVGLTFLGSAILIRLPLSVFGDDGNLNVSVSVGGDLEFTDVAPNAGHLALGSSGGTAATSAGDLVGLRHARPFVACHPGAGRGTGPGIRLSSQTTPCGR